MTRQNSKSRRNYFDNGSRIDNIYKDKNTALNLQLGLRFDM